MCFSAPASYLSGVALLGVGAMTLPLVRDRRQLLFAALPMGFGVHQVLEGAIWQEVDRSGSAPMQSPAVVAWLLFAWLLLPVWLPMSVRQFEPDPRRRRWMLALAGLGAVIGTYLFASSLVLTDAVGADHNHLRYQLPFHPGWLLAVPYVAATCLPLLIASHRFVNRFGWALVVSMAVTAAVASWAFSSVWCFFAALLSVGLYLHYARSPSAEVAQPDLAA
jgi:hypothetical protein